MTACIVCKKQFPDIHFPIDESSFLPTFPNHHQNPKFSATEKEEALRQDLRRYRSDTSLAKGLKAYQVFLNKEMELLIRLLPSTEKEISAILKSAEHGKDYASDILKILNRYR